MSLKVIELNDNILRVSDKSGVLVESPGFALALDKQIQLGDVARQQSRIYPGSSYNKYFHELSLDPISHAIGIRHFADIAYAHLLHLAEEGGIDADVIFAVPGNFTRQQLSILLGLAKQSPFQVVGMVDSALAAAHAANYNSSVIYAEMQLHQVVLTKIVVEGNDLQRESVIQIPGVGSQSFMDLMMQLATGLFIKQCRFNPQHDAESEQQLYNALQFWLKQDGKGQDSLLLELKVNTAVYTIKMPRESLIKNFSGHYKSICQQVAELAVGGDSKILLSRDFAELPGFRSFMGESIELEVLPLDAISRATILNRDTIVGRDDQVQLTTSVPKVTSLAKTNGQSVPNAEELERGRPTHVLVGSTAIPLGSANLSELGRLEKHEDVLYIDSGEQEFLLNQYKVAGRHKLGLGDLIQASDDSATIRLIQVRNV